jgi:hypothetical protein
VDVWIRKSSPLVSELAHHWSAGSPTSTLDIDRSIAIDRVCNRLAGHARLRCGRTVVADLGRARDRRAGSSCRTPAPSSSALATRRPEVEAAWQCHGIATVRAPASVNRRATAAVSPVTLSGASGNPVAGPDGGPARCSTFVPRRQFASASSEARNALTWAFLGAPGRIRTCDARFRKPTLYPLSYGGLS